jgi:hypothetical protein
LVIHYRRPTSVGACRDFRSSNPNANDWMGSRSCELDGVTEQVYDDLNEAAAVSTDEVDLKCSHRLVFFELEMDAAGGNLVAKHAHSVFHFLTW